MIQDLRSSTSHTKRHRLLTGADGQETAGVVGPSVVSALSEHRRFRTGADDQGAAGCPSPAASASSPLPGLGGCEGLTIVCNLPDGTETTVADAKLFLARSWGREALRGTHARMRARVEDLGPGSLRTIYDERQPLRGTVREILRRCCIDDLIRNKIVSWAEAAEIASQVVALQETETDRILILDDAGLF